MEPIELSEDQFEQLFPKIGDADAERYRVAINEGAKAFGIWTAQRISAFLAQIGHETADLTAFEENLHYSGERLMVVFPSHFRNLVEAQFYAEAGPESIANRIYAGRMGNGDEASGDGYRYRGQGLIQLTGKDNYVLAERETQIPLVTHPDMAREIEKGAMIAGWFWKRNDCNQLADHDYFDAISDAINIGHHTARIGDANGYADRFNRWKKARTVFGLAVTGLI